MKKMMTITIFFILIILTLNSNALPNPTQYVRGQFDYYPIEDYDASFEYFPFENKNKALNKISPGLEIEQFTHYDGLGKTTQIQQLDSNRIIITKLKYDKKGRKISISKSYADVIEKFGDPITIDAEFSQQFSYDQLDRVIRVINFDRTASETEYGANYLTIKDEEGRYKKITNDAFGNVILVEEDSRNGNKFNSVYRYEYDISNNLKKIIAPAGHETINEYNSLNQLIRSTSPDTGTTTFSYDAVGNQEIRTDGNGIRTKFRYDKLNRLITVDYADNGNAEITYQYDTECINNANTLDRLCKVIDQTGSNQFQYDKRGRVILQKKGIFANPDFGIDENRLYEITYTYNRINDMTSLTIQDQPSITYQYNKLNQLKKVQVGDDEIARYTYNPSGPVNIMNLGGQEVQYTYTSRDFIESINHGIDVTNNEIFAQSYTYDDVGNIKSLSTSTGSAVFSYDNLDRLTQVNDANLYGIDLDWEYDSLGNRKKLFQDGSLKKEYTYGYELNSYSLQKGTASEIVSRNSNLLLEISSEGAATTLAYDVVGNLIRDTQSAIYSYDEENRLEKVVLPDGMVNLFGYDANGLRTIKKDSRGTTIYVYDVDGKVIFEDNI